MRAKLRSWLGLVLLPSVTTACDVLMTDPAPPSSRVVVSLATEQLELGSVDHVFDKIRLVHLRFTRSDSTSRDTTISVTPRNGEARVRLSLDAQERIPALLISASLGVGAGALFEGQRVVRIEVGTPTSAEIPISPVPSRIRTDRNLVELAVGDTTRLTAQVLFVTGDTIPGWPHQWESEDSTVLSINAQGLSRARGVGQARVLARAGEIVDTVLVRVLGPS